MGGGDLNSKKSWHPNTMKNQERVWKAEQAAADENKRIMELQHERAAERDRTELNDLAKRSAGGSNNDDRLNWMYDKPDKKVQAEDYLLGKSIEKSYNQPDKPDDVIPAVARRVIGSSMITSAEDAQVDLVRKLREDPLLLVKERERAARAALLNNPLHRKRIAELLRKEQEQKKSSKAKKTKKKDKDLDNQLAAKLNALGGEKSIDVAALLASDDSSSSSESSDDKKSMSKTKKKKKKVKKTKKSKKSKKKKNDSEIGSSDDDITEKKLQDDHVNQISMYKKSKTFRNDSERDRSVTKKNDKREVFADRRYKVDYKTKRRSLSNDSEKESKRKHGVQQGSKSRKRETSNDGRFSDYEAQKKYKYQRQEYEREFKQRTKQREISTERSHREESRKRRSESSERRNCSNKNKEYRRKQRSVSRDSLNETTVKRTKRDSSEDKRKRYKSSHKHQDSSDDGDSEQRTPKRTMNQIEQKLGSSKRPGLSEEEKAARLAEMATAGLEREQQRGRRVAHQRAVDRAAEEAPRRPRASASHTGAHTLPDSLESRIHSNRHYIQRNQSHMNEHFARR